jgi:hypothetical protein
MPVRGLAVGEQVRQLAVEVDVAASLETPTYLRIRAVAAHIPSMRAPLFVTFRLIPFHVPAAPHNSAAQQWQTR